MMSAVPATGLFFWKKQDVPPPTRSTITGVWEFQKGTDFKVHVTFNGKRLCVGRDTECFPDHKVYGEICPLCLVALVDKMIEVS